MQPKDWPHCEGCSERQHPDLLVDGFCRDGRYSQNLPKLSCVELAARREPLRWTQTLESVRAAQALVTARWRRLRKTQQARGLRRKEVA